MADTLDRSLSSILSGTDDQFEVLVIDDASTDESVDILQELSERYSRLRYVELPSDPTRHLGATRNISVQEAKGNHVLLQLDADDEYRAGILDFVDLYEQFRDQLAQQFYFKGNGINVAPRDFLLDLGPYRNIGVGAEDRDMWRRLFARESLMWLDHQPFYEEITTDKGYRSRVRRDLSVKTWEFQLGITFPSCLAWSLRARPPLLAAYDLVTYPYAYFRALPRPSYETPEEFRGRGALEKAIQEQKGTLSELENRYDVSIDRGRLSEKGRQIFDRSN